MRPTQDDLRRTNPPILLQSAILFTILVGRPCDAARFEVRETPSGAVVTVAGEPFATYVVDQVNKPFLWPVHGPDGAEMTRAYPMRDDPAEPSAQRDHVHQRGITFGHEHLGGDTWTERATFGEKADSPRVKALGSIRHRRFLALEGGDDAAVVTSLCDILDAAGTPRLTEIRRMTFREGAGSRLIDIDQDLVAVGSPVEVGDRKDAGLSIRVPTTMAVDSRQGGRLVNSEGLADAAAWSQPARWVDYHGPAKTGGPTVGVAMLDHPSSFRHPTRWHVRTYGLFTANPFASRAYHKDLPDATFSLAPGEAIRLRHRFVLHAGDEKAADIEGHWSRYAALVPAALPAAGE
jgi:hypothetical protein